MAKQRCSLIEFAQGTVVWTKEKTRAPRNTVTHEDTDLFVDEELGIAYVGGDHYSIHSSNIRRWRLIGADAHAMAKKKAEPK